MGPLLDFLGILAPAILVGTLVALVHTGNLVSRGALERMKDERDRWMAIATATGHQRPSREWIEQQINDEGGPTTRQRTQIDPACSHPKSVDVEISTGEVVARWCPECSTQIDLPGWGMEPPKPPGTPGRTVLDLKPPPRGPAPGARKKPNDPPCRRCPKPFSKHKGIQTHYFEPVKATVLPCRFCGDLASMHTHAGVDHDYVAMDPCTNCGEGGIPHEPDDCPYPS